MKNVGTRERKHPSERAAAPDAGVGSARPPFDGCLWSYRGKTGPANWGRWFPDCRGRQQSPVSVRKTVLAPQLAPLQFLYRPSPLTIVRNGALVQFHVRPGSLLRANGTSYELVQFHIHTPGEHRVQGRRSPLEAHLVHVEKKSKGIVAVALFLEAGRKHPALERLWDIATAEPGSAARRRVFDLRTLLALPANAAARYYAYDGSLTIPPCSEGVRWYLLKDPTSASPGQRARFRKAFGPNARPLQPLHGRLILESAG